MQARHLLSIEKQNLTALNVTTLLSYAGCFTIDQLWPNNVTDAVVLVKNNLVRNRPLKFKKLYGDQFSQSIFKPQAKITKLGHQKLLLCHNYCLLHLNWF